MGVFLDPIAPMGKAVNLREVAEFKITENTTLRDLGTVGPNAADSQVSYGDFGEEFVVPFGTKVLSSRVIFHVLPFVFTCS